MFHALRGLAAFCLIVVLLVPLQAASVTREGAEAFIRKLTLIQRQAETGDAPGTRRTRLTQDEVERIRL